MHFDKHMLNPYIRVAMHSVLSAGTKIRRRIIFDYELLYIDGGEFILNYNDIDYKCTKGQFLLLRPGVSHSFTVTDSDLSQPHIHFDMFYSSKSIKTPINFKDRCDLSLNEVELIQTDVFDAYPQNPFVTFSDKPNAVKIFYSIISKTTESELVRKARLIQLIDMLISDNFQSCFLIEEQNYNIAHQLKDYIDTCQGFTSKLADYEKQFSYSKYHLERQFKKYYGISIVAYRNKKRMELAEKLLKTKSVSYVSEKLGFTSIYVFSRAFKEHFGISPSMIKTENK